MIPGATWQSDAACRDLDPQQFYIVRGQHVSPIAIEACAHCPVIDDCLDHSLHYENFGFWAGTSEYERRRMRRKLGIQVHRPKLYLVSLVEIRKERALSQAAS